MSHVHFATLEQVLELKENKVPHIILDVLAPDSYAEGHIPDAVNVPNEELEQKIADVVSDKNMTIITYCGSYKCHASTEAAQKLMEMGYTNVLDYKAGKKGWEAAGMPIQK